MDCNPFVRNFALKEGKFVTLGMDQKLDFSKDGDYIFVMRGSIEV
jgi:hypothetical protein